MVENAGIGILTLALAFGTAGCGEGNGTGGTNAKDAGTDASHMDASSDASMVDASTDGAATDAVLGLDPCQCYSRASYYRDRFLYCVNTIGESVSYCENWMDCTGELYIDSTYGNVWGPAPNCGNATQP